MKGQVQRWQRWCLHSHGHGIQLYSNEANQDVDDYGVQHWSRSARQAIRGRHGVRREERLEGRGGVGLADTRQCRVR